jgi:uncharacterized Rmd1/YagE family protein
MDEALTVRHLSARALLLGDRIDVSGLERNDMILGTPLAFKVGPNGLAALYRFGVAVFVGLSPVEEDEYLTMLTHRISGKRDQSHDETAELVISGEYDDKIPPGGPVLLPDLSDERFLCLADALAKSVALGRDEGAVNAVLDIVEPFAAAVAKNGKPPWKRREMLRVVGQALLVQNRVAGRVAVEEKPDVLWDRPDLERLYARLEDEYELKERSRMLQRKLDLVVETVRAMTDILDADRSTRLEATIVLLIVFEILITFYQMFFQNFGR